MEHFSDWFVPTLKFTAIFISGASGILSLLVDFKDKNHKITVWGRRAVIIVVISFIVSATMQGIELHQDHIKSFNEEQKTQGILNTINRQLYNIDMKEISFDVNAELNISDNFFTAYRKRLRSYTNFIQNHPNAPIPKGIDTSIRIDPETHKAHLNGLTIYPGSFLFPDSMKEKMVYNVIGKLMLDVKLYKYDTLRKQLSKKASLDFGTIIAKPRLWYTPGNDQISIQISGLKISTTDYSWKNQGDIQSLLDLKKGRITFCYGEPYINNLDTIAEKVSKKIKIHYLSFSIANRQFSSGKFCPFPQENFPEYYFDLPADIVSTHLDITCK